MTTISGVRENPRPPRLLVRGNSKLGEGILHFDLPAGSTCPGQSPACAQHCYAQRGRYVFPAVRARHARNLEQALRPSFAGRMMSELRRACAGVVRIHTAGDFFSAAYTRAWADIVRACRDTKFFAFTRSWRVPEIREELDRLAGLPNVRLWWSCDRDTGVPSNIPRRVKVVWMQTAVDDLPLRANLVFRVRPLRKTVAKRVGLALVCPVENGVTATDCGRCRICWTPPGR